jgi:hypothetical protein
MSDEPACEVCGEPATIHLAEVTVDAATGKSRMKTSHYCADHDPEGDGNQTRTSPVTPD